jgi:hypothetical protein
MKSKVIYPNLWSKIILSHHIESQFVLPQDPPPRLLEILLSWYERKILKVDTSTIKIDRPIFIIGLPRSGTTILQDVLCSHPDAAFITNSMHQYRNCLCGAEDLRRRLRLNFRAERYLADDLYIEPGSANEGMAIFAEWCGLDPYPLDFVELNFDDFSNEEIESGREIIRRVIWSFGIEDKRFINKNPALLVQIVLLGKVFPDAKIIHIVRDPRMVANSLIKLYRRNVDQERKLKSEFPQLYNQEGYFIPYPRVPKLAEYLEKFGPEDIRTTAHLWNDAISYLVERKEKLPNFYEVRYEDILVDPHKELTKLLVFCELPLEKEQITHFWAMADTIKPVPPSDEYHSFDLVESICKDHLQRYNY